MTGLTSRIDYLAMRASVQMPEDVRKAAPGIITQAALYWLAHAQENLLIDHLRP